LIHSRNEALEDPIRGVRIREEVSCNEFAIGYAEHVVPDAIEAVCERYAVPKRGETCELLPESLVVLSQPLGHDVPAETTEVSRHPGVAFSENRNERPVAGAVGADVVQLQQEPEHRIRVLVAEAAS
jgi:hypothetical protein